MVDSTLTRLEPGTSAQRGAGVVERGSAAAVRRFWTAVVWGWNRGAGAHRVRQRAPLMLAVLLASGAASCKAQRILTITSNPPGAIVRLDDEIIGETPIRRPFLHYGTHRIMFYLPGFLSQDVLHKTVPPWYGRFPLDIVSEVILPIGWRDDERVHAELVPGDEPLRAPTFRSAMDRAEALRRAGPSGPDSLPPAITDDGNPLGDPDAPPPPPGAGADAPVGPPRRRSR